MSASSPEPTSPWQQTDLLGLLAEMDRQAEAFAPEAAEPCPQASFSSASAAASGGVLAGHPSSASGESSLRSGRPHRRPSPEAVDLPSPEDTPPPVAAAPESAPGSPASAEACPARLLILDTETTGLDPARGGCCLEVGAILFDVAHRSVLSQVSFLMPVEVNPAEHVNGIPAAVSRLPQPWRSGLRCFEELLDACDAVLAHNAAFDRQWFGIEPLPPINKPWICSMDDIRWPADRHLRSHPSVRDLSLAYGVPVWAAHRALTDCIYLAQVLERCEDLEALLVAAREPRLLFRARLSYAERHRAKEAGFRWNDPVQGAWTRRLSQREALALPFPVQPVDESAAADSHAA